MKKVFDMLRLDGKVAIVTGGTAGGTCGLGYDIACAFAEAGASLVITSRNAESAKPATESLAREYGVEVMVCQLDQQHYDQAEAMAAAVMKRFGRIDILVNNAGGIPGGLTGNKDGNLFARGTDIIKAVIDVNLTGMIYCCKAVGQHMMRQKFGKIINIGSIAGMRGRDMRMYREAGMTDQPVDYPAAKGGVISVTRALAGLMSPSGICVNSISPGGFDRGEPRKFVELYSERTPLGRMGKIGEDIKGPALLLASSAGDYITGHNLVVDGGFTIWK